MEYSVEELKSILERADPKDLLARGGVEGIARGLASDPKTGISDSISYSVRASKYGTNFFPDRKTKTFFDMLILALRDQTIIILAICAIVSLILEFLFAPAEDQSTAWIDGTAILLAVAIVSLVQAETNLKQEQQFAAVNKIKSISNVAVIRGGNLIQIQNIELLVGDIVQLHAGDKIPADGLFIDGNELTVDQSTASGESETIYKSEADPFLISNTHVVEGVGTMIVLAVGTNSFQGKLWVLINNEEMTKTPLQEKLDTFANQYGFLAIVIGLIPFGILMVPWFFKALEHGFNIYAIREALSYFVVSITIIACAVPEGLPLAVTISLAYSMRQMMTDNNFVRHLNACETMGSATVICTDKTGTLTKNLMTVERMIIGNKVITAQKIKLEDKVLPLILRSIAINSTAELADSASIGSQTECALLRFSQSLNSDYKQLRIISNIVKIYPFDRVRKRMSTVIQRDQGFLCFTKGSSEGLLKFCSKYIDKNGAVYDFDAETLQQYKTLIDSECDASYRTLALAYKETVNQPTSVEEAENDLTLICILSIRDSIREHTAQAIGDCQRAGIRVVMITGDHIKTAMAVAKECHILANDNQMITGDELRRLPREELLRRLETISVVARSTPMDKHLIVTALQAIDNVVAVTGDGTNDVAALMAADVGLAMGKSGTELAKEASDIVILDDDFRSIVKSVLWGRCIYNNIRQFLQFQLTASCDTLIINFIAALFLRDTPFKAVQLLWVNLIMDSLGALALSTTRPSRSLFDQSPPKRHVSILSKFNITTIIAQAIFQSIILISLFVLPTSTEKYSTHHYTIIFNIFVLFQAANLINIRVTEVTGKVSDDFCLNPFFFMVQFGIMFVQFLLIQFGGSFFSCVSLSFTEWLVCLLISFFSVPFGWIIRQCMKIKVPRAYQLLDK